MDMEIKREDIEFHSSNFEKEFPQYVNDLKKYKIEYISCSIRTVLYEGADEYFTTTSVILGTNRKKCEGAWAEPTTRNSQGVSRQRNLTRRRLLA